MLELIVGETELYNEEKDEFLYVEGTLLKLEHSLVSLSKWESKWLKPFLSKSKLTDEEILDYIRCMTITQNVSPEIYNNLSTKNIEEINKYIENPMTATTISDGSSNGRIGGEQVTAEIIYYWMVALQIPIEFQKWHLNRLLTLIKVCNIKNQPPKKMSQKEIMDRNRTINEARKKEFNTKG